GWGVPRGVGPGVGWRCERSAAVLHPLGELGPGRAAGDGGPAGAGARLPGGVLGVLRAAGGGAGGGAAGRGADAGAAGGGAGGARGRAAGVRAGEGSESLAGEPPVAPSAANRRHPTTTPGGGPGRGGCGG